MTNVEAVRLRSGDKSQLTRETARGDGTKKNYKLQHDIIVSGLQVWINNTPLVEGVDYTAVDTQGVIQFTNAPAASSEVVFQYYWAVFTDEEIEYFLTEAGDSVTLAAVILLLTLAADAAKVAMRETMSGGGGVGTVTRDTSLTAQELRETANVLYKQYQETTGAAFPADGLTEILGTVHMVERSLEQSYIREWPE